MFGRWMVVLGMAMGLSAACLGAVRVVERPVGGGNDYYVGNRAPLAESAFIKLPIQAVRPEGWVRRQLELQAEGFVGHLDELSRFVRKDGNAWLSPEGEGHSPWEEMPYWLKGFGDTGYVLGDGRIIAEAKLWIEAAVASQREDGYFGPRANLTRMNGKPDLWPNMVMLFALQSYHEYTGDGRVLKLMERYFRWEMGVPEADFVSTSWQNQRAGDNLVSVYWLYNRTGRDWLLELAKKIHRNTADWTGGVASWHGVNFAQCFRGPGTYWQQSKDPLHLSATERNYRTMYGIYGQVPGGLFGADENCRQGYVGPRQAAETCTMVEMMLSCEMLLEATGHPKWAQRCEDVAFNSLPASMTADLRALHYLTAPNMVLCDRHSKSPGLQNGGPMLLFDPFGHRCCQHNVAHGWPYYAQRLWYATGGNGLAVVFYAPSSVTAKVGDGREVTITEQTRYPFEEQVLLTVKTDGKVRFPLYLRVPGWCDGFKMKVNGRAESIEAPAGSYIMVDRTWADGDRVEVEMPMLVALRTWDKNMNCVSVDRGPLTYSLKIGERMERVGGSEKWGAYEIHPTTAWNYGLVLDEKRPEGSFEVVRGDWPADDQPFTVESAPIAMKAVGRKIPQWQLDHLGLVAEVQAGPVRSDQPQEAITLIPMGCARLRISAFPRIGSGPGAHEWKEPPRVLPTTASHCWENDTVAALSDGLLPRNSNDQSIPRFTWWPRKGTAEWVQYDFAGAETVSGVGVYWFDDTGQGGCRVPRSWRVLYRQAGQWQPVKATGDYTVAKDRFNEVGFETVRTDGLRLEVQLQPDFSGGILEWRLDRAAP